MNELLTSGALVAVAVGGGIAVGVMLNLWHAAHMERRAEAARRALQEASNREAQRARDQDEQRQAYRTLDGELERLKQLLERI